MNYTPPPSGAAPSGSPQNAPFGTGFFNWVRGLRITRGSDRWFAGVAGGIAARAGIDPIIVRGIFVVLAILGGPGLLLYLAGWLLLPDQGGRIHLEEVFRGRARTAAIVATVAVGVFVVLPVFFRLLGISTFGGWSFGNLFGMPHWLSTTISVMVWIAVIAGVGLLISHLFLERGRRVQSEAAAGTAPGTGAPGAPAPGAPVPGAPVPGAPVPGAPAFAMGASPSSYPGAPSPAAAPAAGLSNDPTTGPAAGPTAPPTAGPTAGTAWDIPTDAPSDPPSAHAPGTGSTPPHAQAADWSQRINEGATRVSEKAVRWSEDVGKQADEWSARYAQQHDMQKLGAAHVVITLALALLAAGAASFVAFDMQLSSGYMVTAALLGATAVLAVSLIVAGVRGRNTGWVGFLAACGVIALLFTSVLPAGSSFQPFGNVKVGTTAPSNVLIAGSSEVDLTQLDRTGGTHDIDLWHVAGRSVVTLPATEPVVLTIRLFAGSLDASDVQRDAASTAGPLLSRTIDTRIDKSEPATRVNVYMLAGSVRVEEGSPSNARVRSDYASAKADEELETRAELRDELAELRDEEETIIADLDSSGLSAVREERLENTLDFTRDEIAKLEKELAR